MPVVDETLCKAGYCDVDDIKVIHVIAGLDIAHGGPSYSVPRLCTALADAGVETTLLSVAGMDGRANSDHRENGYFDRRFQWNHANVPILGSLRRSSTLSQALRNTAPRVDVVHNHGLWLLPNIYSGREAARAGLPLIISPRGMLSPTALRFSAFRKRAFWQSLQGAVVRRAACLHATSEQEYKEIRAFGLDNPVAIIPNGIDIPDLRDEATRPDTTDRVVLSLGRIHPIKGLDRLLRAWVMVEAQHPAWRLRIAGPVEGGHDTELRALASALGISRVSIEGPIYGSGKDAAYRKADLFVLPTLNENFGITVAEALAAGTPVLSTKGAPWSDLETEGCGWWIDHGIEPLAVALTNAMIMTPEKLTAMGAKGRAWMARDFSWDRVAEEMLAVYRWRASAGPLPATVHLG